MFASLEKIVVLRVEERERQKIIIIVTLVISEDKKMGISVEWEQGEGDVLVAKRLQW